MENQEAPSPLVLTTHTHTGQKPNVSSFTQHLQNELVIDYRLPAVENRLGRFYKLALTDCETIFEVNLFVSEGA
jgi:hypothetical protein